jgi:hypothetical protein
MEGASAGHTRELLIWLHTCGVATLERQYTNVPVDLSCQVSGGACAARCGVPHMVCYMVITCVTTVRFDRIYLETWGPGAHVRTSPLLQTVFAEMHPRAQSPVQEVSKVLKTE